MYRDAAVAYLESQGLHVIAPDGERFLTARFEADNVDTIEILVVFDNDEDKSSHSAGIRTRGLAKVPANKQDALYPVLNKLNDQYRWATFVLEDDGEVALKDDAIVDLETVGEEIMEEVLRLVHIADSAYPTIQKAIWA